MPQRGVIYCALREIPYLEAALISAFALRQLEPELPIILLTDFDGLDVLRLERFQIAVKHIQLPDSWRLPQVFESRLVKTCLPDFTDFAETLYLDADILPIQPIRPIWEVLNQGVMGLTVCRQQTIAECMHISAEEKAYTLQHCPKDATHFNCGVMLWKTCPEVTQLFKTWKTEWMQFKQHDQLAFARAVHATQLPIFKLANIYNFPAPNVTQEVIRRNEVRLLHCLGGFVYEDRFRAIAQRLMPDSTEVALQVLHGG